MRQKWRMMTQNCNSARSIALHPKLWCDGGLASTLLIFRMIAFMRSMCRCSIQSSAGTSSAVCRSSDENEVAHSPGFPVGVDREDQSPAPLDGIETAPVPPCRRGGALLDCAPGSRALAGGAML